MSHTLVKRLSGLAILGAAVVAALILDSLGEAQQPSTYRVGFDGGVDLAEGALPEIERAIEDALVREHARVVISGHTGTRGDTAANQALSGKRAEAVAQKMLNAGVDEDRVTTLGKAGSEPLEQRPDESERAFQRRLPRAEIVVAP
ncbi:OmpA family protein [Halomonadaceae bacterium KBTZ08]